MEALKRIHTEFCRRCEERNGKKTIDECFHCKWHRLFNEVANNK